MLLSREFSSVSCLFIPLRSKYSSKHLVLNTLCLFSINVSDQVSPQKKTAIKIVVLNFLCFYKQTGRENILNYMLQSIWILIISQYCFAFTSANFH
jgi:hypothetical protein